MAQTTRRVNSRSERYQNNRQLRYTLEDGNAVRVPEWTVPEEIPGQAEKRPQKKQQKPKKKPAVRKKSRRRTAGAGTAARRARRAGIGYVAFLSVVCIVTVFFCIQFLQLKAQLTTQSVQIAALESNLSQLQADNDAYYKKAMASVSMDEVREAAIDRLGMHYPSESQIRYYSTDENSYVRQYRDVDVP